MSVALNQSHLDNPLDRALLAFFNDRQGKWIDRNLVMKACGFDDPKSQPVGAYVQFHASVNRVNAEIAYRSLSIIRSEDDLDLFSLQSAEYGQ